MGFVKQAKAEHVASDARAAREAGHQVFVARLNTPTWQFGISGSIETWSGMIEAIEAEGWAMSQWTAAMDKNGKPEAYPVFRRASGATTT